MKKIKDMIFLSYFCNQIQNYITQILENTFCSVINHLNQEYVSTGLTEGKNRQVFNFLMGPHLFSILFSSCFSHTHTNYFVHLTIVSLLQRLYFFQKVLIANHILGNLTVPKRECQMKYTQFLYFLINYVQ